jgi:hypothetical protein
MRTVAQIDKELVKWKGKTEELQADLAKAEESLSKIEEERAALLVTALAEDNAVAKGKLEGLTETWLRAMRRKGDLEIALKQISQKLAELQAEREEARKGEVRQKKVAAFNEMVAYAKQNPDPLGPWVEMCKRFEAFADKIVACDAELGEIKIIPENRGSLLTRYYQAQLFETFRGMVAKPHPVYLGKTFLQLLEERRRRFTGLEVEGKAEKLEDAGEEREAANAT